ncbi:DUF262 domain-containing HNH endonuclease family protein [Desulfurobacterium sp.]|uniref:DUF262 domain-containing protein n=1 Tax=Desulfurobacterium sp. TaxID=2004706 RepID=UPI0026095135|nr:DUF262 domain-containing HNH endonuclease family protein [Desulfurobacterium sp.]
MSLVSVRDVLNGKFYMIPDYQRSYAWGKQQVRDLFQDLVEATKDEITHFLGTVVFSQTSRRNEYYVVDGQQRLTTLMLLLKEVIERLPEDDRNFYWRLYICEDGRYRLQPQSKDKEFFFKLLEGESPEPLNISQRLLIDAQAEFKRLLDLLDVELKQFLKVIGETQILRFLEEEEGLAIRIFQTINDRGKPLSYLEKIKSYLMYISYRYFDCKHCNKINDLFGEIFEYYDEIKEKGKELGVDLIKKINFTEDSILRYHFVLISKENYDATPEAIFAYLKRKIEEMKQQSDFEKLDDFIISYVSNLHSCFLSLRNIIRRVEKEKLYYETFVCLGLSATLYPLLIALDKRNLLDKGISINGYQSKTFLEILRDVDIKVYKTRGTNPRADISRFSCDINTGEVSEEYIAKWLISYINQWMPEGEFEHHLERNIYGNEAVPYLLIKYSEHLRGQAYSLSDLKRLVSLNLTIEHILPRDPNFDVKAYGFADERDYIKYKDRLGNLTLLSKAINSQVKNKAPLDKTDYYDREDQLLEITKQLATKIKAQRSFDKQDVISRTKDIASFIKGLLV